MADPTPAVTSAPDTRFAMPAVDDPPSTEVGVVLLGLDVERLLAGLGLASLTDDAGRVAVVVDRVRHGRAPLGEAALVAEGARCWRAFRPVLAAACPDPRTSAAVRQAWTSTARALDVPALGPVGPSLRVYLIACWLRRADVDRAVAREAVA